MPFAEERSRRGDGALLDAIGDTAERRFGGDEDVPAAWEPSAYDFLSPALTEAELMSRLLPPERFRSWLDRLLPELAAERPRTLFEPALVDDNRDGYVGHLHGLNLSRAYCWRRLADSLPADDERVPTMRAAVDRHAQASLPYVSGSDYVLEHWLAAYAVLLLS